MISVGMQSFRTLLFAMLLVSEITLTGAFYERGSNVIPIKDETQFNKDVMESDFLWVVEFYREGCGYCQLLTPEWEKVASNLKNMVRVGGVDTERNPRVAGNHADSANPIKGVPTIKLYIPQYGKDGKRTKPKVILYEGERKAKAIVSFVTQYMPDHVKRLRMEDGSYDKFIGDKTIPKIVLITDKSETSTMFKALSTEYKGKVSIGKVLKSDKKVFDLFGPDKLPALLQIVEDGNGNMIALMAYDFSKPNSKSFAKLSNFIWDAEREWKKARKAKGKEL